MADRYDANIDAFWDSRNGQSGATPVLDAELAATIQQLHLLYASSPPNSTRERVRQRVLDPSSFTTENAHDMDALALPVSHPARPAPRVTREPARARPSLWLALAAAAVILFASLGGWFAYERLGGNDPQPAVIPAAQDATPTAGANDWPMYRGNPGRTGSMPGAGPKTAPGVVWSALLDGPAFRSPIVVGDTAYVGTASGTLYALDAETGAERWTFEGDASLEMTPAYQDGIVYIPSQLGTLYAIEATTGSELWRFAGATAEFATPTFGDGFLFVGSETNNALYGIDPKTGEEVWRFDTAGAITRGQAYAEGVLYSGSDVGMLYAVNALDGSLKWQYDAQQESIGTPAVADGVVYATSPTGQLILVDAASGEEIKRIESTSVDGITPPTIGNGLIYIGTWAGTIDAIDLDTEQVIWSYPTSQTMRAALALVDGAIYGVGMDNAVFALDADSGAQLWTYQVDGGMDFGPTVANGMVYVSTDAGDVSALAEGGSESLATPDAGASAVAAIPFEGSQVELVWQSTGDGAAPLQAPHGLSIGPDGTLHVGDQAHGAIQHFAPDGAALESWGESGSGPGQFNAPTSIVFDNDGNRYVADLGNSRIQKFAPDGAFLLEWGSQGDANGQFSEPNFVAIDPAAGRLYVTEFLNNRVQVFDLDGNFIDKWGSRGNGNGQFVNPAGIAVNADGLVFVGDTNNGSGGRVQIFDAFGTWQGSLPDTFTEIWGLAFDAAGNLYVADYWNNRIQVYDPNLILIGTIEDVDGAGPLNHPVGLAIDAEGHLYVSDYDNHRILKLQLPPLE